MFLRVFLFILAIQKACDALSLHPPIANYVLTEVLGFEHFALHDPLHVLVLRLWGCASLAWAYFLFRASFDPKRNLTIVEGSILGFLAAGLVGVFVPLPAARLCGLIFLIEAIVLSISRLCVGKNK